MHLYQVTDFLLLFILVSCTLLILILGIKLLGSAKFIVNKGEMTILMVLSLAIIFWSAAQFESFGLNRWVEYLAFNIIALLLTLYIKVLGEKLMSFSRQRYLFYGVLVFSAMNIWTMILIGPENFLWQLASVLGSGLLILGNAGIIFQISSKQSSPLYRLVSLLISISFAIYIILYLLSMLNGSNQIRQIFLSLSVALVVLLFFYAIDHVYFYSTRDLSERIDLLREEYASEMEMVEDVVLSLARTIDTKDRYTEGHTERVSQYSIFLAERLGLDEKRLETIRVGALIHDIGKIGIDQDVLNKPGKLSDEERAHIETHPILGAKICSPLKSFKEVEAIIRNHHEKLDGSGYPYGIKGSEISQETRIVTIADIFDALTTERSYRPALPVGQAIDIMKEEAREGKLDSFLMLEFEAMLYELGVLTED